MGFVRAGACALAALLLAPPAFADDAERIQQLESEVAELKQVVQDLVQQQHDGARPQGAHAHDAPSPGAPQLSLRGFGSLGYDIASESPKDGSRDRTNHFTDGDLDLFITSQISPRLGFVAETVLEFGEEGQTGIDVERLLAKYQVTDWLGVSLGRGHTPLGYWNQHYHHGVWLATSTDRPLVYRFEDEGGILPVHTVGLEFSGDWETQAGLFSYVVDVGNGRGPITDWVQIVQDQNRSKMVAAMLRYSPSFFEGFAVGANVLLDEIPKLSALPDRDHSTSETIAGFHVVYTEDPFEILVENQFIRHRTSGTGEVNGSYGGYAQLGYKIGRFTPYYRLDWLGVDPADAFYANVPGAEDSLQHVAGIRFDWTTWAAFKLEYRHLAAHTVTSDAETAQLSFTF